MKKVKNVLKAFPRKSILAAFLLLGANNVPQVYAQMIVHPVRPDTAVAPMGYPNSSTINYAPFCPASAPCSLNPGPQLTAMVTDGGVGGPPPMLFINDQVISGWIPVPIPAPPGSAPDVIVGNDITSSTGGYMVGVVVNRPATPLGDIFLFLYKVTNVGTGSLSISGPTPIPISLAGQAVGAPHIDVIAQYSTPYPGSSGLPLCRYFAITWQDATQGIMGYYASLDLPSSGTPVQLNSSLTLSSPDIAAVERVGLPFENWGLLSYVDQTTSPNTLYYQEWDLPTPVGGTPVIYDNSYVYNTIASSVSLERIDAIDDYMINTSSGLADFDIVASANTFSGQDIVEYNNLTGPFAATDITAAVAGLGGPNFVPQVTCGPSKFYSVGYFNQLNTAYFTTAIDWGTGKPSTDPNAYQVDMSPYVPGPGIPFGIAVSTTSNAIAPPSAELFTAWKSGGATWVKYSPSIIPYSFRQASPNAVATVTATSEWHVFPNPTTDHIIFTAPTDFTANESAAYNITDLSGRTVLHGNIDNANEMVDISGLPAQTYIVSVSDKQSGMKNVKIVKE